MNEMNREPEFRENEQNLTLGDIWGMFWNYRWWYVLSVVLCLLIAMFYLYITPDKYTRVAKVIVNEDVQTLSMSDIFSMAGGQGSSSYSSNTNNEAEAFASPDLMEQVVRRLGLETSYFEDQKVRKVEMYKTSPLALTILDSLVSSSFSFRIVRTGDSTFVLKNFTVGPDKIKKHEVEGCLSEPVATPAGELRLDPTLNIAKWDRDIIVNWVYPMGRAKGYASNLTVAVTGKTSTVLALTLEDKFPSRAERILSTLIDVHNEAWIYDKNRSARMTTEFISDRIQVIEKELSAIETDLREYKEENNLTDIKAIGQAYLEELGNVSSRDFEVENQLSIAGYIRDYLMDPKNARSLLPSNSGLSSEGVESQIQEYNKLFLEREKLVSNSSESNPLIADMTQSLDAIRSAILRSIDNFMGTLKLESAKIESEKGRLRADMSSSSGQELELLSIERQQQLKQSLYLYLLQKREENEIASLINVGNTRLIVTPNGSSYPSAPSSMIILLAALVFGVAIPFAILFLVRSMDTAVRTRSDISCLRIPFLAEIPLMPGSRRWKYLHIRRKPGKEDDKSAIVVKPGRRDAVNEAFRVLRTNLDFMTGKDGSTKVIQVSSFNPGSGKTFITMNIAASYALAGAKVLIMDLDLRKGLLGKNLKLHNEGLSMYLSGNVADVHDITVKVQDNMYVIPAGILPPNPSELLMTDRFRNLVSALRKEYDYIFLDCPPVDIVADTAIVARVSDLTIFVVRAGLLDKRALPLVAKIAEDGVYPRMSMILNCSEIEHRRYGYGRYGYGYGYGYGEKEGK